MGLAEWLVGLFEETKEEILEDIRQIQEKVDAMGFKGSNEYDLFLREEISDYIIKLFGEKQNDT